MKLHLDTASGNRFQAHGAGYVVINQATYTASLIVLPDQLLPDWPPARFEDLAPEHFAALVTHRPEVVILGTGERLRFPHPRLTAPLMDARIGLEVMDTAAACRTFNILAGDQRNVAAAILIAPGT